MLVGKGQETPYDLNSSTGNLVIARLQRTSEHRYNTPESVVFGLEVLKQDADVLQYDSEKFLDGGEVGSFKSLGACVLEELVVVGEEGSSLLDGLQPKRIHQAAEDEHQRRVTASVLATGVADAHLLLSLYLKGRLVLHVSMCLLLLYSF